MPKSNCGNAAVVCLYLERKRKGSVRACVCVRQENHLSEAFVLSDFSILTSVTFLGPTSTTCFLSPAHHRQWRHRPPSSPRERQRSRSVVVLIRTCLESEARAPAQVHSMYEVAHD